MTMSFILNRKNSIIDKSYAVVSYTSLQSRHIVRSSVIFSSKCDYIIKICYKNVVSRKYVMKLWYNENISVNIEHNY